MNAQEVDRGTKPNPRCLAGDCREIDVWRGHHRPSVEVMLGVDDSVEAELLRFDRILYVAFEEFTGSKRVVVIWVPRVLILDGVRTDKLDYLWFLIPARRPAGAGSDVELVIALPLSEVGADTKSLQFA